METEGLTGCVGVSSEPEPLVDPVTRVRAARGHCDVAARLVHLAR